MKKTIKFNGFERTPEKSWLLPNGYSVLCRVGANLGLSTIISRKEADKKGVYYLKATQYDNTDVFIYPDNSVRDQKGKYIGVYYGFEQDNFGGEVISGADFGGTLHAIFILKDGMFWRVNCLGEWEKLSPEEVAFYRLSWDAGWSISGEPYSDKYRDIVLELTKQNPMALKAALEIIRMKEIVDRER